MNYQTAIELQHTAIEANRVLRQAADRRGVALADSKVGDEYMAVQKAGDALITFLVDNFPDTPVNDDWAKAKSQARRISEKTLVIDTSSESALKSIDPACVPFALVWRCMAVEKCPFSTAHISAFTDFAGKFKRIIMADTEAHA